jgi:hypothetical protein
MAKEEKPRNFGGNKRASTAIRGARTMGYGRPGVDLAAIEALMLGSGRSEDSAMPTKLSRAGADQILSDARMAAMLRAIRNSQSIPSPETR